MTDNGASLNHSRTDPTGHDDIPISLIDTTIWQPVTCVASRESSPGPERGKFGRIPTKQSVRETLARRKYAKWQSGRQSANDVGASTEEEQGLDSPAALKTSNAQLLQQDGPTGTDVSDFGARLESAVQGRGRSTSENRTDKPGQKHKEQYEVDVLYENQRGMFFFGIPLYSHSSLLNFDPSPWVAKDLKDSAVNITNAQVPDPSWEWAWKTWYVDMSHDVDEEGWQYSFSFSSKFVWHGTHPWFHSFVRRRRWLRKRVKMSLPLTSGKYGGMKAGHRRTADYYTNPPKREKSPADTLGEGALTARSCYMSRRSIISEDALREDIKDVPSLLRALRIATIDREKIVIVKRFIDSGGEELTYLESQIPDIMSFLVFQNSRRQLLEYLKTTACEAQKHREEHDAEDRPEGEAETRRIDSLLEAVKAADTQIKGLEYWSDRKHVLRTVDETGDESEMSKQLLRADKPQHQAPNNDLVQEIKGISDEAEVGLAPTRGFPARGADDEESKDKSKGKQRADEAVGMEAANGSDRSAPRDRKPHLRA